MGKTNDVPVEDQQMWSVDLCVGGPQQQAIHNPYNTAQINTK